MTYYLNGTRGFNSPKLLHHPPRRVLSAPPPGPTFHVTPAELIAGGLALALIGVSLAITEPDKEE